MTTQAPTHWIFRAGDGQNFWNSSHYNIWGTTVNTTIKYGDLMWFVTGKSNGHAIAVATFVSINERSSTTMSDQELGWSSDDGSWKYELHYDNLYDVTHLELFTNISGPCTIRRYNEKKCEVDLPSEYPLIVKYSQAMYHQSGEMVGWRLGGGLCN